MPMEQNVKDNSLSRLVSTKSPKNNKSMIQEVTESTSMDDKEILNFESVKRW